MPDTVAWRVDKCYSEFQRHSIERHGLDEADIDARMFLDLEEFTLTLLRQKLGP